MITMNATSNAMDAGTSIHSTLNIAVNMPMMNTSPTPDSVSFPAAAERGNRKPTIKAERHTHREYNPVVGLWNRDSESANAGSDHTTTVINTNEHSLTIEILAFLWRGRMEPVESA